MWLEFVIHRFDTVPLDPSDNDYHGPYNLLPYTLFFAVTFDFLPGPQNNSGFTVVFGVRLVTGPILILEFAWLKWLVRYAP